MGRFKRIKISDKRATYHVMTRTAHQAFFFKDAAVKEAIYRSILRLASVYYVELHSIAILDNHYHIVLSTLRPPLNVPQIQKRFEAFQAMKRIPQKWYSWRAEEWYQRLTDLSSFMKDVNRTISVDVNRRRNKVGSIWGERFKSVLIEEDAGLLACMIYVELNCVRAGIKASPSTYRWCSVGRSAKGGSRAAGVVIPKLDVFRTLRDHQARQRGFIRLVEFIATAEQQEAVLPQTVSGFESVMSQQEVDHLVSLTLRRTQWLVHSLVLGSEQFCRRIIEEFRLQPGQLGQGEPFRLAMNLCNEHIRAGPVLK